MARAPVVRSFAPTSRAKPISPMSKPSRLTSAAFPPSRSRQHPLPQRGNGRQRELADRPYFRDALRTGQFVVGEYTVSRFTGRPALPLATPIRNDAGEVIGVLAAALDLTGWGPAFARGTSPKGVRWLSPIGTASSSPASLSPRGSSEPGSQSRSSRWSGAKLQARRRSSVRMARGV